MKHRLLSLLGLARRAGKLEAGFDAAKSALRAGQAALAAGAEDLSPKTWKNLRYEAGRAHVPAARLQVSIRSSSSGVRASGFSQITSSPASKPVTVWVQWR